MFSELVKETDNRITIHVNSAGINWSINYDVPESGMVFTLDELLSRIPDLQPDLKELGIVERFASVHSLTYTEKDGFVCDSKKLQNWNLHCIKRIAISVPQQTTVL